MADRDVFHDRPEIAEAVDGLVDLCFARIDAGEAESTFPDPGEFLRERGIDPPEGEALQLRHTVTAEDVEPLRPLCPDGSDGCYPKCKRVKGELHCVWVCRCP